MGLDGSVLYVGKAKSLKNRIANYRQLKQLTTSKRQMVLEAVTVQYQTLGSELEALLVEAELVRLYQPRFNVLLKDDKSPLYIVVTNERFPRVLTTRRQQLLKGHVSGDVFGPYQSAYMAKQVLRAIRPAFRWCNQTGDGQKDQVGRESGLKKMRPCFYYHLGQCSGACVGEISQIEYKKNMKRLKQFLRGQSAQVQRSLKSEILVLAEEKRFEEAQRRKEELEAIQKLLQPTFHLGPDLALLSAAQKDWEPALRKLAVAIRKRIPELPQAWEIRRIEGYDVSNMQGKYASVSMVVSSHGVADPNQYRLFNIRSKDTPDDYGMLAEALTRRQKHAEWGLPDLVLIDGGVGQVRAVQSVWRWPVPVIGLAKDPDRLVFVREDRPPEIIPVADVGAAKLILQSLRDEAHRFSRKQVRKRALESSIKG